ncbi:MAG: hypothetical protein RJA57_1969 [Bacteroidota bacterium]|jgi:shikimate kinase
MRIYLIGFMGSGKSHWGRQLGQKLGIPFFDLDEQVVAQAGKPIAEMFEADGEEAFRQLESETLHILTESHDSFVMACGGGTPCFFNNIDYMNRSGVTLWIHTPLDVLHERLVREKASRPLIRDLSDEALRAFIARKFAGRRIYYEQAAIVVEQDPLELHHLIETIFHA